MSTSRPGKGVAVLFIPKADCRLQSWLTHFEAFLLSLQVSVMNGLVPPCMERVWVTLLTLYDNFSYVLPSYHSQSPALADSSRNVTCSIS